MAQEHGDVSLEDLKIDIKAEKTSAYTLTAVSLVFSCIAVGVIYLGVAVSPFAFAGLLPIASILAPLNMATKRQWQRIEELASSEKPAAQATNSPPVNDNGLKNNFLSVLFKRKAPQKNLNRPVLKTDYKKINGRQHGQNKP